MTSIDAVAAAALVAAAVSEAHSRAVSISVAVVDDAGSLVAFHRMSPAPRFSADFAIAKARTSAAFSVPTSSLEELYKERPAFANFPAGILIQGGLPLMHKGECVGAIGVSGVQSHEDEQVAQAGVNALG